jgi:hypothetical protein
LCDGDAGEAHHKEKSIHDIEERERETSMDGVAALDAEIGINCDGRVRFSNRPVKRTSSNSSSILFRAREGNRLYDSAAEVVDAPVSSFIRCTWNLKQPLYNIGPR